VQSISAVFEQPYGDHRGANSEASRVTCDDEILNMLMVVCHDIRSPLISMAATLKLLIRGVSGRTDERASNALKDLYERIMRLIGTTEDCLGKASVVTGAVHVERRELDLRDDIIDPVLDELSPEIAEQDITINNRLGFTPAIRIPILVNRLWLKTVFRNLFRNAIKYGGKGCTITFGYRREHSNIIFNVYNDGPPIPEKCRPKLFEKFCRIRERSKGNREGMGLGLYLVKEIIKKHGGDIWYEARENGSNFLFTVPCE